MQSEQEKSLRHQLMEVSPYILFKHVSENTVKILILNIMHILSKIYTNIINNSKHNTKSMFK